MLQYPSQRTCIGVLLGLMSGALWGLSYVLPTWISGYTALEITMGRYIVYGLISLLGCLTSYRMFLKAPAQAYVKALVYAITGNVFYYLFEVLGIQALGPSCVLVAFCFLPLCISFVANLCQKTYSWRYLTFTVTLMTFGLLITQADSHLTFRFDFTGSMGLVYTTLAILLWCYYSIDNAFFLRRTLLSPHLMNNLTGVFCLLLASTVLIINEYYYPSLSHKLLLNHETVVYLQVIFLLGLFTSWLGTLLWNLASTLLPTTLMGQLVTSEIVFGLIYVHLYDQRLFSISESIGVLMILSTLVLFIQKSLQPSGLSDVDGTTMSKLENKAVNLG